jgi:hypothetical protein
MRWTRHSDRVTYASCTHVRCIVGVRLLSKYCYVNYWWCHSLTNLRGTLMTLYGDLISMHGTTVRNIDRPFERDEGVDWWLLAMETDSSIWNITVVSCMMAKLGATYVRIIAVVSWLLLNTFSFLSKGIVLKYDYVVCCLKWKGSMSYFHFRWGDRGIQSFRTSWVSGFQQRSAGYF